MDEPLKGKYRNAKVFIRVFPSEKINWDFVKIGRDKKSIYCRCLHCYNRVKDHKVKNYWHFRTDGVFYNCSQKEIYANVTSGVIESVFKGHNTIILAYGQSGSGKSLTTLGLYNSHHDCGIAPRIIIDIFTQIRSRHDSAKINVTMSCIEITNTRFADLFDAELKLKDQSDLIFINRLALKDENDALSALYRAEARRQFVDNSVYESHKTNFVMTLEVTVKKTHIITGKIHVVDLAGADFYGRISCTYKELFDVAVGNLAKSQMEQFLLILCENIPEHIAAKQRLNALICYLKDSLNNKSLLRFIGHIYTNLDNQMVTVSMLRFAHILLCLPPKKLESNISETEEYKISYLEQRVKDLEMEKLLQSMILNTNLSQQLTHERIEHLQNLAKDYLQGATNELAIINVSHVTTFLKVFKDMYNCLKAAKEKQQQEFNEKLQNDSMEMSKNSSRKMSTKSRDTVVKSRDTVSTKSTLQSQQTKGSEKTTSEQKPLPKSSSASRVQKPPPTTGSQASIKAPTKTPTSKGGSRRKSSTTSTTEPPKEPQPTLLIPEAPPNHEQAYNFFTTSNEHNYGGLNAIKDSCAIAADGANKEYIEEVKRLKELNEALELRKGELLQAQMQKQFIGEPDASEIEKMCFQRVMETEVLVMEQQEMVLRYQTDLKLAVENYGRSKRSLSEEFDKFCMDKFKTLIPEIEEEKPEIIVESVPEEKEQEIIRQLSFKEIHNQLQQTMQLERKKAAAKRREKNRQRWFV